MLLILSLSLLYFAGLTTLLIFLTVTVIAYITCYTAKKTDRRVKRLILCILIPVLLLPLAYYKYAAFISKDILGQEWDTFHNLIVPIGISFYTFQTLAFCLDTLRNNQEVPSFIDYMNFCSFFPQIVAGPIERRDNLLPQMQRIRLHLNSINLQ
ncbi:MAG: hypothetical protein IJ993_01920, partial [Akkermansia sp.]|nr:hypothetical protein [Akkermansia sp.]